MTLLDLLITIHDQQYIRIIDQNFPYSPETLVDGTVAYVIRSYDFKFYMKKVNNVKPVKLNNQMILEIKCS